MLLPISEHTKPYVGQLLYDKKNRQDLRFFFLFVYHPIDSLYTVESVKDTVPVIEHIFGAKNAR